MADEPKRGRRLEECDVRKRDFNRRHAHNYTLMAQGRAEAGEIGEAETLLRRALRHDAKHAPAWRMLGSVLMSLGRAEEAQDAFRRAVRGGEAKDPTTQFELGQAALAMGDPRGALRAFREARDAGMDDPALLYETGMALLMTGEMAQGRAAMQEMAERYPEHPHSWGGLAIALRAGGDSASALKAHRRALALDPSDAELREGLARTLLDTGAEGQHEAQLICAEVLAEHPRRAESQWVVASAAMSDTDGTTAVLGMEAMAALPDDPSESLAKLARVMRGLGRPDLAASALVKMLAEAGEHPALRAELALVCQERGDTSAAKEHLKAACAMNVHHETVIEAAFELAKAETHGKRKGPASKRPREE